MTEQGQAGARRLQTGVAGGAEPPPGSCPQFQCDLLTQGHLSVNDPKNPRPVCLSGHQGSSKYFPILKINKDALLGGKKGWWARGARICTQETRAPGKGKCQTDRPGAQQTRGERLRRVRVSSASGTHARSAPPGPLALQAAHARRQTAQK